MILVAEEVFPSPNFQRYVEPEKLVLLNVVINGEQPDIGVTLKLACGLPNTNG